jgi:transcriptional regulator MraZ
MSGTIDSQIFFGGNALAAVTAAGAVRLPRFVRDSVCGRSDIIIGAHQTDPCLVTYPRLLVESLLRDLDRRRIEDESKDPEGHFRRARRIFGFAHEISLSSEGRLVLPPALRQRGGIGSAALFVGIGRKVEIWSLDRALEAADTNLRALAAAHVPDGSVR